MIGKNKAIKLFWIDTSRNGIINQSNRIVFIKRQNIRRREKGNIISCEMIPAVFL